MLTYLKTEILRVLRNRRYVLFALVVPVGIYLLFGKLAGGSGTVRGTGVTTFFMVCMAAYSAMLAVVFMGGARLAAERTRGWTRLLRITPLPAWGYLATKLFHVTTTRGMQGPPHIAAYLECLGLQTFQQDGACVCHSTPHRCAHHWAR